MFNILLSLLQCLMLCSKMQKINLLSLFLKSTLKSMLHSHRKSINQGLPSLAIFEKKKKMKIRKMRNYHYFCLSMVCLWFYIRGGWLHLAAEHLNSSLLTPCHPHPAGWMGKKLGGRGVRKLVVWNKLREIPHQILLQQNQTWLEEFKLNYWQ